jgi:hypothetical protein
MTRRPRAARLTTGERQRRPGAVGGGAGVSHQTWQMNEINNLIWPSPEGAYTNEIVEEAWALLGDLDLTGDDFEPIEVTLVEGGV